VRSVKEKIMFDAMISTCCANFLSDIDVKPGTVQGGGVLNEKNQQRIRFSTTYHSYSPADVRFTKPRNMLMGQIRRDGKSVRATLEVDYTWFRFRESKDGFSMLILWDKDLPMILCANISNGNYHLNDIIDLSRHKPLFFVRSNPYIHSVKNVSRMRTFADGYFASGTRRKSRGLLITMIDDWSEENWSYWSPDSGYRSTIDNPRMRNDPRGTEVARFLGGSVRL
jgi:hypothetical protein